MTGQIKKKLSTDRFVNPYTFYPGPDKKVSYEEYEDKKEYLTGKITEILSDDENAKSADESQSQSGSDDSGEIVFEDGEGDNR